MCAHTHVSKKIITFACYNFSIMAQQLTIKQIAEKAGVSVGTVDRILHNRGSVSEESRKAVEDVLSTCNYRRNIHKSAVAFKKTGKSIKLMVVMPSCSDGEFWSLVRDGINRGLTEYGDISIECKVVQFDRYDAYSCRNVFQSILEEDFHAVVIAPIFTEETRTLCHQLSRRNIPYVFVDGKVPDVSSVGSYTVDQAACGKVMARLINAFTPADAEVGFFLPRVVGTLMTNNTHIRTSAFVEHFAKINPDRVLKEGFYSTDNPDRNIQEMKDFLAKNPNVKGVSVMISTSHLIVAALKALGRTDIVVGAYDLTSKNAECVRDGSLTFVIDQHPEQQGFNCIESLLHYLLYGDPDKDLLELLPIDVIMQENITYWSVK